MNTTQNEANAYREHGEQGLHDADLAGKINGMTLDERLAQDGNASQAAPDYEDDGAYSRRGTDVNSVRPATASVRNPSVRANSTRAASVRPTSRLEQREEHYDEPSRSYAKPIPIVTTYDNDIPDNTSRRASKAGSIKRSASRANSVRAGSQVNGSQFNGSQVNGTANGPGNGTNVGEIISHERQQELQGGRGVQLQDGGAIPHQQQQQQQQQQHDDRDRGMSPRPRSAFGYRPEPNLQSVAEDGREYNNGRDSRAGVLGRNGTVISRSATMGRNGTMSRATNGGTVGSRRGAFGRGAGASIGTQPEEVLGRDDIHTRAELSERILDEATLRRLSTMEKKDAKRLSKVIKAEGKAEAQAVQGSIKELERLVKLQKEAAYAERKSQSRLTKWTSREHKARLRFLKEKERYERVEGELRNAENDYEERRDHAGGLTAQVAEKTQELDDLRGQKAADDREREVKLLALRNPAHS